MKWGHEILLLLQLPFLMMNSLGSYLIYNSKFFRSSRGSVQFAIFSAVCKLKAKLHGKSGNGGLRLLCPNRKELGDDLEGHTLCLWDL